LYGPLSEKKRAVQKKVLGLFIGFVLRFKRYSASLHRKIALIAMYRVEAHRL
jgi:hypothetical protein